MTSLWWGQLGRRSITGEVEDALRGTPPRVVAYESREPRIRLAMDGLCPLSVQLMVQGVNQPPRPHRLSQSRLR